MTIALLLIILALAVYGGFVLHQVSDTAKRFDERSCEVFAAEKLLFEQQLCSLKETVSICTFQMVRTMSDVREAHAAALQGLADAHGDAMQKVNDTHGNAARLLEAATGAHHQAAGANAEACNQLREATANINQVVSNADVFAIREHLVVLRNFFIPKQA